MCRERIVHKDYYTSGVEKGWASIDVSNLPPSPLRMCLKELMRYATKENVCVEGGLYTSGVDKGVVSRLYQYLYQAC